MRLLASFGPTRNAFNLHDTTDWINAHNAVYGHIPAADWADAYYKQHGCAATIDLYMDELRRRMGITNGKRPLECAAPNVDPPPPPPPPPLRVAESNGRRRANKRQKRSSSSTLGSYFPLEKMETEARLPTTREEEEGREDCPARTDCPPLPLYAFDAIQRETLRSNDFECSYLLLAFGIAYADYVGGEEEKKGRDEKVSPVIVETLNEEGAPPRAFDQTQKEVNVDDKEWCVTLSSGQLYRLPNAINPSSSDETGDLANAPKDVATAAVKKKRRNKRVSVRAQRIQTKSCTRQKL
jgi:hypothetical protein